MAKRQTKSKLPAVAANSFAPPAGTDLWYIPEPLRALAVRIDSLVLDPKNVKDHGEEDLPTHQASLRDFGIRRVVIVRTANRQVEAGNGTCMSAIRNGWEYVPAVFVDDDQHTADAYAFADNVTASLANWNEDRLKELTEESQLWMGTLTLETNFGGLLGTVMDGLGMESATLETPDEAEPEVTDEEVEAIQISHRITVVCESEADQKKLMAQLEKRGYVCHLADRRVQ